MEVESFEAPIVEAAGGGAYVEVPKDVRSALGRKGRIPVSATLDGIPYRGSIVTMGGVTCLGVLKAVRASLGKRSGDLIRVTVEVDTAERSVTVSDELHAALVDGGVRDAFAALSYSHQREYVTWIDEAKRPATRARRISETVARLRG